MPPQSTLYRRIAATSQTPLRNLSTRAFPSTSSPTRAFSLTPRTPKEKDNLSTSSHVNTSNLPDDEHSLSKAKHNDTSDVQTSNLQGGLDSAKKNHEGGHATEGRDSAGGVAKAKREHPEAPDPAIGMQDERGGRGG